jgi:hypothetical protein
MGRTKDDGGGGYSYDSLSGSGKYGNKKSWKHFEDEWLMSGLGIEQILLVG